MRTDRRIDRTDLVHRIEDRQEKDRRTDRRQTWSTGQTGGQETDLVHRIEDSLMSSVQTLAVQSPTDRKFLGKKGFLCRA